MAESSVYISVLTITAFSVERYLAICHPFFVRGLSQLSRVSRTIPVIWLVGFVCAIPIAMQIGLLYHSRLEDHALCTIVTESGSNYLVFATSAFFILPMLLMVCLYTLMGLRLRSSGRNLGTSGGESRRTDEDARNSSTKRVLKMLGRLL